MAVVMIGVLMKFDMRFAKVVYSEQEAHDLGLAIDRHTTQQAKPKQSIICIDATEHNPRCEAADALSYKEK